MASAALTQPTRGGVGAWFCPPADDTQKLLPGGRDGSAQAPPRHRIPFSPVSASNSGADRGVLLRPDSQHPCLRYYSCGYLRTARLKRFVGEQHSDVVREGTDRTAFPRTQGLFSGGSECPGGQGLLAHTASPSPVILQIRNTIQRHKVTFPKPHSKH